MAEGENRGFLGIFRRRTPQEKQATTNAVYADADARLATYKARAEERITAQRLRNEEELQKLKAESDRRITRGLVEATMDMRNTVVSSSRTLTEPMFQDAFSNSIGALLHDMWDGHQAETVVGFDLGGQRLSFPRPKIAPSQEGQFLNENDLRQMYIDAGASPKQVEALFRNPQDSK